MGEEHRSKGQAQGLPPVMSFRRHFCKYRDITKHIYLLKADIFGLIVSLALLRFSYAIIMPCSLFCHATCIF